MKRNALILTFLFINFFTGVYAQIQDTTLFYLRNNAANLKNAESYIYVAEHLMNKKNSRKLFYSYMDSAYHAAVQEKSHLLLGQYYNIMGNVMFKDDNPTSRYYDLQAIYHFQKLGVDAFLPFLNSRVGMSYFTSKKIDSAFFYFHRGLHLNKKKPDDVSKNIYRFLMLSHKLRANNDSTIYYSKMLSDLCLKTNDLYTLLDAQYTQAKAYEAKGDYKQSVSIFKKNAETAISLKKYKDASIAYNAASTYLKGKEKLYLGELALKYAQKAKDKEQEGASWNSIAHAYSDLGDNKKALNSYRNALSFYSTTGNEGFKHLIKTAMTELFLLEGQQDSAWYYMQQAGDMEDYSMIPDSLHFDSVQTLKTNELMSGIISSERKIKLDTLQKQYLEQENKALKQRIVFIIVLFISILVIIFLFYKRHEQKRKAGIYAKNKEDEFAALHRDTELRLTRRYIDGLENERKRIAQDLHDGVCNDLLALEMVIKSEKDLDSSLKILEDTRNQVRNISHELLPPVFQYESINEMLTDYTAYIDKPEGMKIEYTSKSDKSWDKIPSDVSYEIYRIIQETLSNSIKHSGASLVNVSLDFISDEIGIIVSDNGKGFDISKKYRGIGIHTVEERVKSLNGYINIDSGLQGTRITIGIKL